MNKLSLPNCVFLPPWSNINRPYKCVYFWVLYSVSVTVCLSLRQCHAALITMVLQYSWISGGNDTSIPVFISQDCCGYLGSFVLPYEFLKYFFSFCEIHHRCLDRNCTDSVDGFGQYGRFDNVNSSYPLAWHMLPFTCIFFNFLSARLLAPWFNLLPGILYF